MLIEEGKKIIQKNVKKSTATIVREMFKKQFK